MKKKVKSRNVLTQKRSQKIEKDKKYSEAENFNDAQKVITLEKQKEKMHGDNADLKSELQNIISEKETETQQKYGIEKELEELKKEVKLTEENYESLEQEALDLAEKTQDVLINLDKRLEIAEQRQGKLENAITKLKQYQENRIAESKKQLELIWSMKCQEVEENEQKEEDEIKNMMKDECDDFTKKINATNDDITRRENEIAKLEKKLHEQALLMAEQVTTIENDIQKERREYELQMNAKLAYYKAEAKKLACMNEKIVCHYENKMKTDSKVADMEKQQIMESLFKNETKKEFQSSVSSLEEKLTNDVKTTMEWANHYSELESKKKAALSELDDEPTENSERIVGE